jgi:hypothetical protein
MKDLRAGCGKKAQEALKSAYTESKATSRRFQRELARDKETEKYLHHREKKKKKHRGH